MAELETPKQERSPKGIFPASSPTRMDRLLEKEELQHLNDRLAVYIERMRRLEEDNSKLNAKLVTYEESEVRQFEATKTMYEAKNLETKKLLDEALDDNRKLRVDNTRIGEDLEEMRKRIAKESKEREKLKETVINLNKTILERDSQIKELDVLRSRNRDLEAEIKNLQGQLKNAKAAADNALMMQQRCEEQIRTLEKDLEFYRELYEKQAVEMKTKIVRITETTETDFKEQYDITLKEKLQEIREEYEQELEEMKLELVEGHKAEVDELKTQLQNGRSKYEDIVLANQDMKATFETIKSSSALLESKNAALEKRVADLEQLRVHDREEHGKLIRIKDEDIRRLNEDYDELMEEYNALAQIKITLDLEISNYKKLLEGEEARLKITPPKLSSSAERRGEKRPRSESSIVKRFVSSNAEGPIKVSEVDPEGRFIKIFNSSTMDEPLGGWTVQKTLDGKEPVTFKFNVRSVLKGGAVVTVWSSNAGAKHKPPQDLVMKDADWGCGGNSITTILNPDDKVVARLSEELKSIGRDTPLRPRRRRYEEAKSDSCVIS